MSNPLHELAQDLRADLAFGGDGPLAQYAVKLIDGAFKSDRPEHFDDALRHARIAYRASAQVWGDGEEQMARIDAAIGAPISIAEIAEVTSRAGFRLFRSDELLSAANWLEDCRIDAIEEVSSSASLHAFLKPVPTPAAKALGALSWAAANRPIPAHVFDECGRAEVRKAAA